MAKNTGEGYRKGAERDRSQLDLGDQEEHKFVKRDTTTGQFTDLKEDDKPFKGVAKEPDKRKKR